MTDIIQIPHVNVCRIRRVSQLAAPGRKILVCGDMLELGNYAESLHREMGAKVAND